MFTAKLTWSRAFPNISALLLNFVASSSCLAILSDSSSSNQKVALKKNSVDVFLLSSDDLPAVICILEKSGTLLNPVQVNSGRLK